MVNNKKIPINAKLRYTVYRQLLRNFTAFEHIGTCKFASVWRMNDNRKTEHKNTNNHASFVSRVR